MLVRRRSGGYYSWTWYHAAILFHDNTFSSFLLNDGMGFRPVIHAR